MLTFGIPEARGFDIVYGDIDSCFVVRTERLVLALGNNMATQEELEEKLQEIQTIIKILVDYIPPLKGMRLDIDFYDALLLVDKRPTVIARMER